MKLQLSSFLALCVTALLRCFLRRPSYRPQGRLRGILLPNQGMGHRKGAHPEVS